jgi:hypothetical protein
MSRVLRQAFAAWSRDYVMHEPSVARTSVGPQLSGSTGKARVLALKNDESRFTHVWTA